MRKPSRIYIVEVVEAILAERVLLEEKLSQWYITNGRRPCKKRGIQVNINRSFVEGAIEYRKQSKANQCRVLMITSFKCCIASATLLLIEYKSVKIIE
jgi:hypothetical protein